MSEDTNWVLLLKHAKLRFMFKLGNRKIRKAEDKETFVPSNVQIRCMSCVYIILELKCAHMLFVHS